MKRKGQSALEYLFMLAITLVLIVIFVRRFLTPRSGTLHKLGSLSSQMEDSITSNLDNMISS